MIGKTKKQLADLVNSTVDCEECTLTEDNIKHLPNSIPNWGVKSFAYDNTPEGRELNQEVDDVVESLSKGYYILGGDVEWDDD